MSDNEDQIHESPTLTVMMKHFNKPQITESEFPFDLQAFCNELDEIQFKMIWLIENGRPSSELPHVDRNRWIASRKELGFVPPEKKTKLILMPNKGEIIT